MENFLNDDIKNNSAWSYKFFLNLNIKIFDIDNEIK